MVKVPLEQLVEERYALPEWVTVRELRESTGFGNYGSIDLATFNCFPSKGGARYAFEVKRSRSDFLRELRQPGKRSWVESLFHETYFVVVPGVCEPEEVPEKWGLLVATKNGKKLIRRKIAVEREIDRNTIDYWMVAGAMRKMAERQQDVYLDVEGLGSPIKKRKLVDYIEKRVAEWGDCERRAARRAMDNAKEAQARADNAVAKVEEPLRVLRHEAGESWWGQHEISGDDVNRWVEKVRSDAAKRVEDSVRTAHKATGELLRAVGCEEKR